MKIKTYAARDMRQALRIVRDEQGSDAVILSTRYLEDSVEVSVALESAAAGAADLAAPASVAEPAVARSEFAQLLNSALTITSPAPPPADSQVGEELRSMRHLLEWQLSQLAWNDLTRRAPRLAELLKSLTEMGLGSALAIELLEELPVGLEAEEAQRRLLALLARRLPVTGDGLLDQGGRVALVGPTGVGKTTGIAKLAARWVMRHGARDLALVAMDDQRFGAHEQLRVLGRLLGVETYAVDEPAELPQLLARLSAQRLVLIDTAGLSARDPQLAARANELAQVAQATGISVWLTLSAGAQAAVLEETVQHYAALAPESVLLTKLDEAASLGGVLSTLIASGLPLSYVSEGPRIPEDLAPARAHQLVSRAVLLSVSTDAAASDELLARKYGRVAHEIR
jgi:flagellar biosynthesis protein FlhF